MTATGDLPRCPWAPSATCKWGDACADCDLAAESHHRASDRLDMHPDDLLGNESVRNLCAHHLGQETPVTRPTLLNWRRKRGFPEPLPCGRAGVELWDARQVRVWVQAHAENLPKTRPANLRSAPGT